VEFDERCCRGCLALVGGIDFRRTIILGRVNFLSRGKWFQDVLNVALAQRFSSRMPSGNSDGERDVLILAWVKC